MTSPSRTRRRRPRSGSVGEVLREPGTLVAIPAAAPTRIIHADRLLGFASNWHHNATGNGDREDYSGTGGRDRKAGTRRGGPGRSRRYCGSDGKAYVRALGRRPSPKWAADMAGRCGVSGPPVTLQVAGDIAGEPRAGTAKPGSHRVAASWRMCPAAAPHLGLASPTVASLHEGLRRMWEFRKRDIVPPVEAMADFLIRVRTSL
jgi:hypothetical protein